MKHLLASGIGDISEDTHHFANLAWSSLEYGSANLSVTHKRLLYRRASESCRSVIGDTDNGKLNDEPVRFQ